MNVRWYSRDASFFDRPNTSSVKQLHLPHLTRKSKYGHTMSLCGLVPIIDDQQGQGSPSEGLKCKRCLRCLQSGSVRTDKKAAR